MATVSRVEQDHETDPTQDLLQTLLEQQEQILEALGELYGLIQDIERGGETASYRRRWDED